MNLDTDAKTESCSEGASMMTNDDATAADTGCATFRPRAPEEEEATGSTTTSDCDVDRDREGRECNGLESFFLRFNVRFAVGLTLLPPCAATATRRRAEVSEAFATSLGLHGADIEAVSSPPPPSPAPAAATGDAATTGESPPSPHPPPPRLRVRRRGEGFPFDVASFRRFGCRLRGAVDDNVGRDLPADGPPSLTLYTLTSEGGGDREEDGGGGGDGGDAVVVIVVNINHALFDAITMRAVLKTFLRLLQEEPVEKEEEEEGGVTSSAVEVEVEEKARRRPVALEWGDLVRTYPPPNSSQTPRFLPMPYSAPDARPLKMSEVVGGGPLGMSENDDIARPDDRSDDVVVVVDPETFRRCRSACRARAATLTGLWMSCLSRAIAEADFRNLATTADDDSSAGDAARRPCRVAISVLVDLRRYFPDDMRDVLQVQSTVTVGVELAPRDVVEQSDDSVEGGERGHRTAEALLEGAANMTSDLRARIGRGEAHRQAEAMSGGGFDGGCPVAEATVELSNHGAYHTPPPPAPLRDTGGGAGWECAGCEVELSQRFDGYRGMSVVVYSESGSDTMKAVASFGDDVCRSGALDLMNRVRGLFELVSRLEDKASTS